MGETDTVRFVGDLDIATAGALREQLLERSAAGVSPITVDLAGVEFMDSVGLSLLISAYQRIVDGGAEMILIMPERLRPLMEMSGLAELLDPRFVEIQT